MNIIMKFSWPNIFVNDSVFIKLRGEISLQNCKGQAITRVLEPDMHYQLHNSPTLSYPVRQTKFVFHSWFQTFAMFWSLFSLFLVILRPLNFKCPTNLIPVILSTYTAYENETQRSETSEYTIQTPENHPNSCFIIFMHTTRHAVSTSQPEILVATTPHVI
jgi:hypothetical protein